MSASLLASWLFAAGEDPRVEAAWKIFWTIVVLIVIVIVTGGLIMFITRWTKRTNSAAQTYGDDHTSFQVLYERVELTEEEYQKIRSRLGQKLKEQIKKEEGTKEGYKEEVKAGAAKHANPSPPETDNRLRTAEPASTIRPATEENSGANSEGTQRPNQQANDKATEAAKPNDSDPSVKPA